MNFASSPRRFTPYKNTFRRGDFLMQPPEKYVNHSCEANTEVKNHCDVAIRYIKKGDEITSDYNKKGSFVSFICKCGSKRCRGIIKGK